jgi:metal-sulfur cluster biosynthetic enzyme
MRPGREPGAGPARAPASDGDEDLRHRVLEALRDVVDPELGLDIVAMGLVYDVRPMGEAVEVDMTLTTPGCPVAESLPAEAAEALRLALPDEAVEVRVVWDPPWTPERLAPEALAHLGTGR